MPELPEVEAVVKTLRPLVKGRKIRHVEVFHPIATKPQETSALARLAQGQKILNAERRGKYILLLLQRGVLTFHFKLDGQLVWFKDAKDLNALANSANNGVHVDVALELDRGVLGFADQRHFGRVHAWRSVEEITGVKSLGIDALDKKFTPAVLAELLTSSRRPLKDFLLDQTFVAGIGNMYSCESLWLAKLSPRRAANSLSRAEANRLHKAIVSVLARALECCLHPPPNFRDPEWWFQGIESILRVYDREGEPCKRDGAPIERIAQGGRSTYYCKRCQL